MKTKHELIEEYNKTVNDIQEGNYVNLLGDVIDFPRFGKLKRGTKKYDTIGKISDYPTYSETKIYTENIDTFLKAKELGPSCAVLNMASARTPGGGVTKGSRAQEEELCRRSNLIYSLYSFTSLGKKLFGFDNTDKSQYPISVYGGIYSPGVCVYKTPNNYNPIDTPYTCSVISVAGIIHPEIDPTTGMMLKKYVHIVKEKIRTILRIAIINGHSKLVLGALGCGAFKNPPKHIALIFKQILEEKEFSRSFEEICFAILDDGNSGREHNPDGNFKPFVDVFGIK